MTELAYLADPEAAYVRVFRAHVTALPPGTVVLDRTFFYPTGGGQPNDLGTLRSEGGGSVDVVDVTKSGASVLHRIRGSPGEIQGLTVGLEVEGEVDWPRRYRHMRLHTAQHFLSARIFERNGLRTRKAQIAGNGATLDLEGPLPPNAIDLLATDFEETVAHPRPVRLRHLARAEWDRNPYARRTGLVPLPAHVDPVRVVEIEEYDVCPCGGTHLRSTGEIGAVTLRPPVPVSGGDRVGFTLDDPSRPTPTG